MKVSKDLNKLPCIDCILLPICKVRVRKINTSLYLSDSQCISNSVYLSKICSLVKNYVMSSYEEAESSPISSISPIVQIIDTKRCRVAITYITKGTL